MKLNRTPKGKNDHSLDVYTLLEPALKSSFVYFQSVLPEFYELFLQGKSQRWNT